MVEFNGSKHTSKNRQIYQIRSYQIGQTFSSPFFVWFTVGLFESRRSNFCWFNPWGLSDGSLKVGSMGSFPGIVGRLAMLQAWHKKWHIHEPSINPAAMNSGWSWEGLRWALSVATVFSATRRSVSPPGKSSRFCTFESRICKLSLDSAKVASRKCTKISARWHKDLWSHIIEPSLVWGVVLYLLLGMEVWTWAEIGVFWNLLITASPNLDVSWRFQNSWHQWIKFCKTFRFTEKFFRCLWICSLPQGRLGRSTSLALKFLERRRDPAMEPATTWVNEMFVVLLRGLVILRSLQVALETVELIANIFVSSYDPMLALSGFRVWRGGIQVFEPCHLAGRLPHLHVQPDVYSVNAAMASVDWPNALALLESVADADAVSYSTCISISIFNK